MFDDRRKMKRRRPFKGLNLSIRSVRMDLAHLNSHGFQILPAILSANDCDQIIAAIEQTSADPNIRQPHLKTPQILAIFQRSKLRDLLSPPWRIIRSIYFDKTAEANWSVPWHQDLTICVRERHDVPGFGPWSIKDGFHHVHAPAEILDQITTIRIHLDDCGPENGPLRVLPNSHQTGRLSDTAIERHRATTPETTCLVPKGGALLMKPSLLHASSRATNPNHRRVIHLEVTTAKLPPELNWL
jgi:ectoine hydroxylase-related dioxygenase (phytanoyl-CoA dioxygenase family)